MFVCYLCMSSISVFQYKIYSAGPTTLILHVCTIVYKVFMHGSMLNVSFKVQIAWHIGLTFVNYNYDIAGVARCYVYIV